MLQKPSLPHMPEPQTPASPPHNPYPHVPPLKPRKSPLLSPCCMQAVTSTSPLCHMQVCWHRPLMVCKTHHDTALTPSQHSMQAQLQHQPTLQKPCHGTTPMQHTSPAMVLTRHTQAPPQPQPTARKPCHLNTVCKSHHTNPLHISPTMTPPTMAPCKSPTTNLP